MSKNMDIYILRLFFFLVFFSSLHAENKTDYLLNDHSEGSTLIFPSEEFKKESNVKSFKLYEEAKQNREAFWARQASFLEWFHPWDQVLEWNPPYAKWFLGGKINACYNCLDRHLKTEIGNKIALLWEGENGDNRALTYNDLFVEVSKFSNVLKSFGIKKGDKVAIYLPMIPEAVIAMLSCARIHIFPHKM